MKFKIIESKKSAKQKYLKTGKIQPEKFQEIIQNDPTNSFKYAEFLCKIFLNHDLIVSKEEIAKFEEGSQRGQVSGDINQKSYEEFQSDLSFESGSEEDSAIKEESNLIYEDERFKIFHPQSHRGSVACGNPLWCTAYRSDRHWNQYQQYNVKLFYIHDNQGESSEVAIAAYDSGLSQQIISNPMSEERIEQAKSPQGFPNPEGGEPLRILNQDITLQDFVIGNNIMESYDEKNHMISTVDYLQSIEIGDKLTELIKSKV